MDFHFNNVWTALSDAFPNRAALICEEKTITWSQFNDRAARLASLFEKHGVTNGASVGLYMLNCNEYTEAHFGCFKQSICPVNVNYRYRAEELIYLLDNSDSEVVIYHASFAPRITEIKSSLPKIKLYIQVDDGTDYKNFRAIGEQQRNSHSSQRRNKRSTRKIVCQSTGR